jgi:hypothetical protein
MQNSMSSTLKEKRDSIINIFLRIHHLFKQRHCITYGRRKKKKKKRWGTGGAKGYYIYYLVGQV